MGEYPHRPIRSLLENEHREGVSIGTPGSYGILQTPTQMLLNILELGINGQQAIDAPGLKCVTSRQVASAALRVSPGARARMAVGSSRTLIALGDVHCDGGRSDHLSGAVRQRLDDDVANAVATWQGIEDSRLSSLPGFDHVPLHLDQLPGTVAVFQFIISLPQDE